MPEKAKKRKNRLIVIVGPTSSGKTALAVKLAKLFNGEIVSADSRQVYKGMDVGTGKDLAKYGRVPHHLIDVISPKRQFSLAQFQKLAYLAIDDIIKRGKMPILAGGTGLYVQAIIDGYLLAKSKPNEKLRDELNKKTIGQLQDMIKNLNIDLNQSDFNNKRRLIRMIEIQSTAKNFKPEKNPKYDCLILGLKLPQEILNHRIDQRLVYRLKKQGLIDEVKQLQQQGVSWQRLEAFGLEYKWIAYFLQNKIDLEAMLSKLSIAIHQFAKRQLTWFKKDNRITWTKNYAEAKNLVNDFLKVTK